MITFTEQRNLLKIGDFRERVIQSILTAALAIQMTSTNPSDSDIDGAMGAIWNSIALAMFPELQAPPPEEQGGGA